MSKTLKVGDQVIWRGGFGMEPPRIAEVEVIERTEWPP